MAEIKVLYPDGTLSKVPESGLELLIAKKEIHAFQRADGWVLLERGPLRKDYQNPAYSGPKKRQADLDNYVG